MGGDRRFPLAVGEVVAAALLHHLSPHCERIEIAGSIRRRKRDIGDIEIVCIPKLERATDLFGKPTGPSLDSLADGIASYSMSEKVGGGALERQNDGERYIKLYEKVVGIQVDLFVVRPPAEWGAIYAIRTGSGDFSKKLVTGLRARGYRCEDGRVLDSRNERIPCPEENDFFKAAGVQWIPPERR